LKNKLRPPIWAATATPPAPFGAIMDVMPWLMMWSTSVSIVGRAVIADVASSAENNGTAMNKVADLFVSLGRRGNMWRLS
jgi:hypothetical protein